jgi:hypothetical protein
VKKTRGTAEWAYRCNDEGADRARTERFLRERGFLWRSLHNADGDRVASVKNIEVGDTIHVYFMSEGKPGYLSSWLVEPPDDRADEEAVTIQAVRAGPLFDELGEAGYATDPELGYFTGFRVRKDEYATEPLRPRWVGRHAITRVERPITKPE